MDADLNSAHPVEDILNAFASDVNTTSSSNQPTTLASSNIDLFSDIPGGQPNASSPPMPVISDSCQPMTSIQLGDSNVFRNSQPLKTVNMLSQDSAFEDFLTTSTVFGDNSTNASELTENTPNAPIQSESLLQESRIGTEECSTIVSTIFIQTLTQDPSEELGQTQEQTTDATMFMQDFGQDTSLSFGQAQKQTNDDPMFMSAFETDTSMSHGQDQKQTNEDSMSMVAFEKDEPFEQKQEQTNNAAMFIPGQDTSLSFGQAQKQTNDDPMFMPAFEKDSPEPLQQKQKQTYEAAMSLSDLGQGTSLPFGQNQEQSKEAAMFMPDFGQDTSQTLEQKQFPTSEAAMFSPSFGKGSTDQADCNPNLKQELIQSPVLDQSLANTSTPLSLFEANTTGIEQDFASEFSMNQSAVDDPFGSPSSPSFSYQENGTPQSVTQSPDEGAQGLTSVMNESDLLFGHDFQNSFASSPLQEGDDPITTTVSSTLEEDSVVSVLRSQLVESPAMSATTQSDNTGSPLASNMSQDNEITNEFVVMRGSQDDASDLRRSKGLQGILSDIQIEFLRKRRKVREYLIEKLREQGFGVEFDFIKMKVLIEADGRDIDNVLEYIKSKIIYTEIPADVEVMMMAQTIQMFDNKDVETMILVDELSKTLKCAHLMPERGISDFTQQVLQSFRGASIAATGKENVFRCKGWEKREMFSDKAQAIMDKHSCSFEYRRPRRLVGSSLSGKSKERGPPIKVIFKDIQLVETDVIVNSTNPELNLNLGRISTVLLKVAGEEIQKELKEKYKDKIKCGEIAKSGVGKMQNCKAIYHGCLTTINERIRNQERQCFHDFVNFILNCLLMATRDGMQSIAFPALGTGINGYPMQKCVQVMHLVVWEFLATVETSLTEVIFAILPSADSLLKQLFLAENFSKQLGAVQVETAIDAHQEIHKHPSRVVEVRLQAGKTLLQLSHGEVDTVFTTADVVLVLWLDAHLNKTSEHPIVSQLNESKQQEIFDKYVPGLLNHEKKYVMDDTSVPPCRLLHLYCKDETEAVIVRALTRGLKELDKDRQCLRIGIPIPSDGSWMWQPHVAGDQIAKAVFKVQGFRGFNHVIQLILEKGVHTDSIMTILTLKGCKAQPVAPDVTSALEPIIPLRHCQELERRVGDLHMTLRSDREEKNLEAAKELKQMLGIHLMFMDIRDDAAGDVTTTCPTNHSLLNRYSASLK